MMGYMELYSIIVMVVVLWRYTVENWQMSVQVSAVDRYLMHYLCLVIISIIAYLEVCCYDNECAVCRSG